MGGKEKLRLSVCKLVSNKHFCFFFPALWKLSAMLLDGHMQLQFPSGALGRKNEGLKEQEIWDPMRLMIRDWNGGQILEWPMLGPTPLPVLGWPVLDVLIYTYTRRKGGSACSDGLLLSSGEAH